MLVTFRFFCSGRVLSLGSPAVGFPPAVGERDLHPAWLGMDKWDWG